MSYMHVHVHVHTCACLQQMNPSSWSSSHVPSCLDPEADPVLTQQLMVDVGLPSLGAPLLQPLCQFGHLSTHVKDVTMRHRYPVGSTSQLSGWLSDWLAARLPAWLPCWLASDSAGK